MPWRPFITPLDPALLRAKGIPYVDDLETDKLEPESPTQSFESLLSQLPDTDADMLRMALGGLRQFQMVEILGLSQAGTSFHFQKALRRLKFVASRPQYTREELTEKLTKALGEANRIVISKPRRSRNKPRKTDRNSQPPRVSVAAMLVLYWYNGSFSHTAEELKICQPSVLIASKKAINKLTLSDDPEVQRIADTYRQIQEAKGWMFKSDQPLRRKAAIEDRRVEEMLTV
jgi:hypothetical protein